MVVAAGSSSFWMFDDGEKDDKCLILEIFLCFVRMKDPVVIAEAN